MIRTPSPGSRRPSPARSAGGLVMSISTLTRCSSMPSADTLVNAAGSTRRTRPSTGGPPQRSITTRRPGLGLHRIGGEQFAQHLHALRVPDVQQRRAGRPAWLRSAAPRAAPRRSPARARSAAAALRAGCAGCSAAAAWACSCTATSRSALGHVQFAPGASQRQPRACPAATATTKPSPASFSGALLLQPGFLQRRRRRARLRAAARSTPAAAAFSRACASRALRSSTMDDITGVSTATVSPGADAVALAQRDARQPRGDRRRDGVAVLQPGAAVLLDGLLEAALRRPRRLRPRSGRGANAQASAATAAAPAAIQAQVVLFGTACSFPCLERGHHVEPVDAPAHHQRAGHAGGHHAQRGPGIGARPDHHRKQELVRAHQLHERMRQRPAQRPCPAAARRRCPAPARPAAAPTPRRG